MLDNRSERDHGALLDTIPTSRAVHQRKGWRSIDFIPGSRYLHTAASFALSGGCYDLLQCRRSGTGRKGGAIPFSSRGIRPFSKSVNIGFKKRFAPASCRAVDGFDVIIEGPLHQPMLPFASAQPNQKARLGFSIASCEDR